MASFSDLPNEMVREVADHVSPEDIENFSLISKGVYAVALPLLEEHRVLKKRYSAFENLEEAAFDGHRLEKSNLLDDPVTLNCAPRDIFSNLLLEVLANRRVAPYIKELRQEGWCHSWDSEDPDPLNEQHHHILYNEEQFAIFKHALSTYVLPSKLETWIKELESGHEGPIISLLLILLPNISSIKFEQCNNLTHQLRETIERINTDCVPDIPILSRLERVNMQYNDYFDEADPTPIDFLAFLATIPSLKSLYGQQIAAWGGAHDFSFLLPQSSNITDLGFKMCNLSLGELGDLFQGLKALRTFHYIYDTYDNEEDLNMARWDPAGMCKLLSKHAQRSLEVLDLRSEQEPVGPIENLRDFEVLKELTLSFSLFQVGGFLPCQTLASELPVSIQKLFFHDIQVKHVSTLSLKHIIRELVHFKPHRFPRLEKICFCASWDLVRHIQIPDKLRELCEDAGFELCFLKLK